jgi:hypothetical protein
LSKLVLNGDVSGSVTLDAPSAAGTTTLTLPTTSGTVVVTSGAQTIEFADGSASTPSITNSGDTNTGMFFPAADTIAFAEGGAEAMRLDSSGNVGIGTTTTTGKLTVSKSNGGNTSGAANAAIYLDQDESTIQGPGTYTQIRMGGNLVLGASSLTAFFTNNAERMRIKSDGTVMIGTTTDDQWFTSTNTGFNFNAGNFLAVARSGGSPIIANRLTSDGDVIEIRQAGTTEGTISVSGTTVSYNGGHLSRWSQFDNETGKPEVYRGTVLESVDAMCVWEKDGEPLPNEQATKTIVSTTPSSKAVAGVFDRYDEDDEDNPYDFYVAQSGDFVIRIAQGVTIQNGDLLESAGDGTARPQADDICRSSTIAKVTSNYVSATYEDGSYCVPCILMIG